jgi:hypothetical protein
MAHRRYDRPTSNAVYHVAPARIFDRVIRKLQPDAQLIAGEIH